MNQKFQKGDKVTLVPYEEICEIRGVSTANEYFKRYYDYTVSKELIIDEVFKPGDLTYNSEEQNTALNGTTNKEFLYRIKTPKYRSSLFAEEEINISQ